MIVWFNTYLNKPQSNIQQVKMIITESTQKVLDKLDKMYKGFILHGLHGDFEMLEMKF